MNKLIDLVRNKFLNEQYSDVEKICEQLVKESKNIECLNFLCLCKYKLNKQEEHEYCLSELEKLLHKSDLDRFLGLYFLKIADLEKSKYHLEKISNNSKDIEALSNLALIYKLEYNYEKSIDLLIYLCEISNWQDIDILSKLAKVYVENLEINKSIDILRKILSINPNSTTAKIDLSFCLFLVGEFDNAWNFYVKRPIDIENLDYKKKWNGEELTNETILFFCEQGAGDFFNFVRFASYFKEKFPNCNIKILDQNNLCNLIKNDFEITNKVEKYDYWCSLIDLPFYLKLNKKSIKDSYLPYIKSNKICNFSDFDNLYKIGICWAGNPAHSNDRNRSCSLLNFKDIYKIPNIKLFSLQKDLRPRIWPFSQKPIDLAHCTDIRMIDMSPYMNDWEDAAAIISGLDLVISVDTSILHLSAAMGKKTFGLLPYLPDWRWELETKDSYWYPNLQLFRQFRPNDWRGVFFELEKCININI